MVTADCSGNRQEQHDPTGPSAGKVHRPNPLSYVGLTTCRSARAACSMLTLPRSCRRSSIAANPHRRVRMLFGPAASRVLVSVIGQIHFEAIVVAARTAHVDVPRGVEIA